MKYENGKSVLVELGGVSFGWITINKKLRRRKKSTEEMRLVEATCLVKKHQGKTKNGNWRARTGNFIPAVQERHHVGKPSPEGRRASRVENKAVLRERRVGGGGILAYQLTKDSQTWRYVRRKATVGTEDGQKAVRIGSIG